MPETFSEIGVLAYPSALSSAVEGLTEMFLVANQIAAKHEGLKRPLLRVSRWQEVDGKISCVADTQKGQGHELLFALIPPSFSTPIATEAAKPFAQWLLRQHGKGTVLGSICAGSFVLGETGLLEGRSCTTHWSYASQMQERFTDTQVEGDKLLIDDGDIITAGGFMAWTDMGLRVVHRLLGPTIMMELARFMLVDPPGREQRYYSPFAPVLHHGDENILRVQHWLQKTSAKEVELPALAKRAGLEPRTFLRRFTKATGLKPIAYCQHLRVGRARELLEFTRQNISQIAYAVGYEDTTAFNRIFHRLVGLTPGEYRLRFNIK